MTQSGADTYGWRVFLRRHWGAFALFVGGCAAALAGSLLVFNWFAGNAVSTSLVPAKLGLWTISNLVHFGLYLILWEVVLVGIPVIVGAVAGWAWWRRLPDAERGEYRLFGRGSRSSRGGGGASLLFFIAFCIKVYLDGNWNSPISTFTLDYVVGSVILIIEWALIVFGIPFVVVAVWWLRHQMKVP